MTQEMVSLGKFSYMLEKNVYSEMMAMFKYVYDHIVKYFYIISNFACVFYQVTEKNLSL